MARGRMAVLRNTVEGRRFCTVHNSQTVYHEPAVYADDPVRPLGGRVVGPGALVAGRIPEARGAAGAA